MTREDLELKKLDLEVRKLETELRKIEAETDGLRSTQSARGQTLEWLKAFAGLGAAITAVVALFGLWLSVARWHDESEQVRKTKEQEQIGKAFDSLSAESPSKRLSGVASVRSSFATSEPEQQTQILDVLISVLALEKESVVRDSIVAMIKGVDLDKTRPETMLNSLNALVRASRTLVIREDLRNFRMDHPMNPPTSDKTEAIAGSIGESIINLLRNGVRTKDLSGIYCVKCNFSGMDLSRMNFNNAVLYLSNFENSRLIGSSFDAADLDHTRFENSDLQGAKLTHLEDRRPGAFQPSYIDRIFNRLGGRRQIAVYGPTFNCADLRGADFTGHPIFGFASKIETALLIFPASFVSANLEGTKFANSRMFGSRKESETLPFPSGGGSERMAIAILFQFDFSDFDFKQPGEVASADFDTALHWLRMGFSGSNWKLATLPKSVQSWLQSNPPPETPDFGRDGACKQRKFQYDARGRLIVETR